MPVQVRQEGESIIVDGVDLKRTARSVMRMLNSADPVSISDLPSAMDLVARAVGFPNLHSCTAEARRQDRNEPAKTSLLESGSAEEISAKWISLLPDPLYQGAQRARFIIGGLAEALAYLRDHHDVPITIAALREFFKLEKVEALAWTGAEKYGLSDDQPLQYLQDYLTTLPGYQIDRYGGQGDSPRDWHGDAVMILAQSIRGLVK